MNQPTKDKLSWSTETWGNIVTDKSIKSVNKASYTQKLYIAWQVSKDSKINFWPIEFAYYSPHAT